MKKVLLVLAAMFVFGLGTVCSQNYDVVYSLKMNPDKIVKDISSQSGVPKALLSFLKDDIRKAKLLVSLKMTDDKSDMTFLKDRSKFEIRFMGMSMDAAKMFDNAGINRYCDYSKNLFYTKMNVDGQAYIVKDKTEPKSQYTPVNLYKKILGHECKKMTDKKSGTTLWYAVDIPFKTKMYPGVPGLVLEMSEDSGSFLFTATSVKSTNKDVSFPHNAKEVTRQEMQKMMKHKH